MPADDARRRPSDWRSVQKGLASGRSPRLEIGVAEQEPSERQPPWELAHRPGALSVPTIWRALSGPLRGKKNSMWQTVGPAPAMTPVVRRRASLFFSLDRLCTRAVISSRQSRQKATSGCEGTGLFEPKQDSAPGQRSRERKERAIVAGVGGMCVWLWLKRHGGPAAPDSGCRLAGLAGWQHAPTSYICVRD